MAVDPRISVIIPAYNAEKTIAEAIKAVLDQKDVPGGLELIIVDDGSLDLTARIVSAYPSVRYVYQTNAGPASARNHGARLARGAFLYFTDSDCRPQPTWVSVVMQGFEDRSVAVVAGSYGIANPGSWLARVIHAEIIFRHKTLMPRYPKFFGSYNFAVRREIFEAAGGFNIAYRRPSGEDNDLSYRITAKGGRVLFNAQAAVDHHHQHSLVKYLKEQFRHGVWRAKMYFDHPAMVGGDGYTFWKDAVEVPLVLLHVLIPFFPWPGMVVIPGFLIFELIFGCLICSGNDSIMAGIVMWLRAFGRTAGFLSGGMIFLVRPWHGMKKS